MSLVGLAAQHSQLALCPLMERRAPARRASECGIAARGIARTFGGGLGRSTVAHFARKVRGGRILWRTSAENPTKSCAKALVMFATCSWPSLCEQSELQCWRRNRRLCEPVQISAARALSLTFDISILNTLREHRGGHVQNTDECR